jgi:hypothetical protein
MPNSLSVSSLVQLIVSMLKASKIPLMYVSEMIFLFEIFQSIYSISESLFKRKKRESSNIK